MENQENQPVSKYNAAIAQLYRMDNLYQLAHQYSLSGKLMDWNWVLDKIWAELAADPPATNPGYIKKSKKFMHLITKHKNNKDKLFVILLHKEIFLRKLQNEQGKGTVYEDESEDDWD